MFWYAHVIMSVTVLAVIGFFVLFAATKSSGLLGGLGKFLGAWLYLLAVAVIVCGIIAPMAGWHVFGARGPGRGPGPWMERGGRPRWEQPAVPNPAPTPQQPAAPTAP